MSFTITIDCTTDADYTAWKHRIQNAAEPMFQTQDFDDAQRRITVTGAA